jgi:glycosyltransferase involved in cell wall biosynthesis
MACGVPVVASTAEALTEVGADAVLYAPPEDASQLAHQIERTLEDEPTRSLLRGKGPERAASFSWEAAAEKTAQALEEAARESGGATP